MKKAFVVTGFVTVVVALGNQACTLGSDTYITAEPGMTATGTGADGGTKDGSSAQSTSSGDLGPAGSCSGGTFSKVDLSKLTACENGKGHCFDKTKTPMADQFIGCANAAEVCVPDELLEAAGGKLKSCTSVIGAGGCITISLIPEMQKQGGSVLKQDVCDADQVCAPCTDPTNGNAPTPFCQPIGVFEGKCEGGSAAPAPAADAGTKAPLATCCGSGANANGVCLAESAIPEDSRSNAPKDSCASGNLCVPKSMVDMKPVTCNGGLMGKGVCLDTCFNEMMGFASMIGIIGRDRCESTEVCVPCNLMSLQGGSTPIPGCE